MVSKNEVKNVDLRVMKGNITMTQIAREIGVTIHTISLWFTRSEMDPVRRTRVINAINRIREREQQERQEQAN